SSPCRRTKEKGVGFVFAPATKRLMAFWSEAREWKTPRLRRRLVNLAKNPRLHCDAPRPTSAELNHRRGEKQPGRRHERSSSSIDTRSRKHEIVSVWSYRHRCN